MPALDEEDQKSSGLWVGPPSGSTAAQRSAGGRVLPLASRKLQFVVREPYRPWPIGAARARQPRLTQGLIDEVEALTLRSKMRSAKLFLDGDHLAYALSIGDVLTYRRSDEPLTVLGLRARGGATPVKRTKRPR
jgi:NAD+ kinase